MAHWSTSPEAGQELEVEYDALLQQYRALKLGGGSIREAKQFQTDVLEPVAIDLRAARQRWRGYGEAVAAFAVADNQPVPEGGRAMVKTENNVEGFVAPGDPEQGDPVHTVEQDEDGTKTITAGPLAAKKSKKSTTSDTTEDGAA